MNHRLYSDFEVFTRWCQSKIFTGKLPFGGKSEAAVPLSVLNNDRPLRPVHHEVSDRVWEMIQRCWDEDPFQRMTGPEAEVVDLFTAEASDPQRLTPWPSPGI